MKASESMRNGEIFPNGMRVLVVDDEPICLLILKKLLCQCRYQVTTCTNALSALELLRENKDNFDLVISDVHMPDMDGFKLLEIVGLEMDLPVIMMSANGETSTVKKGIIHGACDYLIKPVRLEELRNIWQHVVRKKKKGTEQTLTHEEVKQTHGTDDGDLGALGTYLKKRKDAKEEENDRDEDPSSSKKPRVVWSVELHQQFVNAVNQLGIDKAVPKRILELMNVQGLTRENVASHLQKYRLYLKRINSHQQEVSDSKFGIVMGTGLGELNSLAAAELSQQALISSLHSSLIGKLNAVNMRSIGIDPLPCLQFEPNQGSTHGQPLQVGQLNQLGLLQLNQLSQLNLPQCDQLSHFSLTEFSQLSLPQASHLSYPQVNQPSLPQISQISLPDSNMVRNPNYNPSIVGDNSILNFTSSDANLRQPSSLIDIGGSFMIGDEAAIQLDVSSLSLPSCLFDQFDNISQISKNKEPYISSGSTSAPSYFKLSSQLTCSDHDVKSMGAHDIGMISRRWQALEGSQANPKSGHIQGSSSSTLINNAWAKSEIGTLKVKEEGLVGCSESIPPISGAPCYNEQACTSVEHKGKGVVDLSSLKVDNSALSESFHISDDILHLILKQQQGGLGFTEDDLGADGSMLNDIYVQ